MPELKYFYSSKKYSSVVLSTFFKSLVFVRILAVFLLVQSLSCAYIGNKIKPRKNFTSQLEAVNCSKELLFGCIIIIDYLHDVKLLWTRLSHKWRCVAFTIRHALDTARGKIWVSHQSCQDRHRWSFLLSAINKR